MSCVASNTNLTIVVGRAFGGGGGAAAAAAAAAATGRAAVVLNVGRGGGPRS